MYGKYLRVCLKKNKKNMHYVDVFSYNFEKTLYELFKNNSYLYIISTIMISSIFIYYFINN